MQLALDDDDVQRIATAVADLVIERMGVPAAPDRWMNSAEAAEYLGLTGHALDKLCAARRLPFEQEVAGGKRWFQAHELDRWRRGERD